MSLFRQEGSSESLDSDVDTDDEEYHVLLNKWLKLKEENLRLQHDLVQSHEQNEKQSELVEELVQELVGLKKKNESLEHEVNWGLGYRGAASTEDVHQKGLSHFVQGGTSKGRAKEVRRECISNCVRPNKMQHSMYIHMSIRSSKEIGLLLVEPLDLERVIHKSKRAVDTLQAAIGSVEIQASIDTIHPASIDTFHPTSIDIVQPTSINTLQPVLENTVHQGTVHRGTIHSGTVHPLSIDTVHPTMIDTVHLPAIDTVHLSSIDTVHPASVDTVHSDTVHRDTVYHDTVHHGTVHPMTDTTCLEAEKVEVLTLKVDENGMLRDKEGRTRNNAGQLINAQGAVIPDIKREDQIPR
ncbi:hypothetical protein F2Q69_00015941 [Brassica cretica]|uniref:Uncharacterized protein n=1 Tax=Brassica cretica TaxID=69181 RepID=A0A8S9R8G9_BRACR|nr:hypothetical protein F2Q69_00015941 [Brassica cretica]